MGFKKHFYVITHSVNLVLIPVFLICAVTGILLFPGFLEFFHVRARNFPTEIVAALHDWTGVVLAAGIFFHIVIHWNATVQFVRVKILGIHNKRKPKSTPEPTEEVLM